MICSKCKIDKDPTNFQTYWHSTQQKFRTRRECTSCLYHQRLKRKNPDMYYKDEPNYKKCSRCQTWKHIDNYYRAGKTGPRKKWRHSTCKACCSETSKLDTQKLLEKNGGGLRFYQEPNRYYNDIQKREVFKIMTAIGWTYNEENGIWWKKGLKDKQGTFVKK